MDEMETSVAGHYTTGDLYERIIDALRASGIDPNNASADDLKLADEFHTGGVAATKTLFDQLNISSDMAVLDVGSGIGGTSRFVAQRFGAQVTGIDLTPEFVDAANRLNTLVGLSDKITHKVANALDMGLSGAKFDLAFMIHVGMNIPDKSGIFAGVASLLRTGGTFAVFDVMALDPNAQTIFPLPWSARPETSFVETPADYKSAALGAGFELIAETDRGEFAKEFFETVFAKVAQDGPAPLGIHLMMGESAGEKLHNYQDNLLAGRLSPVEMIFRLAG